MRSSIFSSDRSQTKAAKRGKPAYISKSGSISSNQASTGSSLLSASSIITGSTPTSTPTTPGSTISTPGSSKLKISWNLDDLISSYTELGSLPPILLPTLPDIEKNDSSPAPFSGQNIDDDSEEDIPLSMLSPTLPLIFEKKTRVTSQEYNYVRWVNKLNDLDRPRFLLRINFDTIEKYRGMLRKRRESLLKQPVHKQAAIQLPSKPLEKQFAEKVPMRERLAVPEKLALKEKLSVPEKIPAKEKLSVPEKIPTREKLSVPEKQPTKEKLSIPERLPAKEKPSVPEKQALKSLRLPEKLPVRPENLPAKPVLLPTKPGRLPLKTGTSKSQVSPENGNSREQQLILRERELDKREKELQHKLDVQEETERKRKFDLIKVEDAKKEQIRQLSRNFLDETTSPKPKKRSLLPILKDHLPPRVRTPKPNLPQTPTLPNLPVGPSGPSGQNTPAGLSGHSTPGQRDREEIKNVLLQKKNHWMQIARSTRQKAEALRNDPPRGTSSILPFIIDIDSLILRMISYDYDERSKIIGDVLPSERSWKNLNQEITELISELTAYYSTPQEKNKNLLEFSRTLVCILFLSRAMVSKRINAILSKVIQLYKSKNSPQGELNGKIIELQQLHLDNNNQIIADFINSKPEFLNSTIPQKFPQTYHRRKLNLKQLQQEYDLNNATGSLKPKYQNFYLPFGVYSNVSEATVFTYHILNEFIDIFNKYNPNDPMKYVLQSGQ